MGLGVNSSKKGWQNYFLSVALHAEGLEGTWLNLLPLKRGGMYHHNREEFFLCHLVFVHAVTFGFKKNDKKIQSSDFLTCILK